MSSAICFNLDQSKILSSGNGLTFISLTPYHTVYSFNPFPKQQNLDSSNLKKIADDNFRYDETGRKFSKSVESTVGKGEIAHY